MVTSFFLLLFLFGCSLPSDNALIQRFQGSHNDLERLRQMVDEDNLDGRIHADYADPHLPDVRLAEYRKLMRAAGIMRLWAHGRSKPLELIVDANGWLAEGEYKGYTYDPSEQQPSSASLDISCFEIAQARKEGRFCSANAASVTAGGWSDTSIVDRCQAHTWSSADRCCCDIAISPVALTDSGIARVYDSRWPTV